MLFPLWYVLAVAFAFGSIFGSFANVVIYRVPQGISVVKPPSACPNCGRRLPWYENFPIFGYLFLRGRCSGCGKAISVRYPLVELLVAVLWVATVYRVGLRIELVSFLVFITASVMVCAIDLEFKKLPRKILNPALIGALAFFVLAALFSGDLSHLGSAALGAFAYSAPLLAMGLAIPGGIGLGDARYALLIGLVIGWLSLLHVLVAALSGFMLGGLAGMLLLAAGKGRKFAVPFGPFMAVGSLIALYFGDILLKVWLGPLAPIP